MNLSGPKQRGRLTCIHLQAGFTSLAFFGHTQMKSIAVIGGGITGVTTAYALAKRGFKVTLFEKHRYAAMETSFANGGQLSASNAEVWTHLSTIVKGMKWMLKADAQTVLVCRVCLQYSPLRT